MKTVIRIFVIGCCLLAADLLTDGLFNSRILLKTEAEARIGRPLTPVSVAGVARRTTRRTIRRTAVYAATLPRGCSTVVIEGTTLHQCGGTYYQPYGNQFVIVNVD
ncbi:MAG: hypothetical protein JRJ43_02070 [Deltaproteobacteria bacterium]|nr:hypothetical protein [Deltaproteobacteria bacterium]MBW1932569.1 hypothetical protein [Deltaproteobacteria bacterium]MBW2349867.1 hypothetical protein [Deltaproteobacteria bacterium]